MAAGDVRAHELETLEMPIHSQTENKCFLLSRQSGHQEGMVETAGRPDTVYLQGKERWHGVWMGWARQMPQNYQSVCFSSLTAAANIYYVLALCKPQGSMQR